MKTQMILATYDIMDDKRRLKLLKAMKNFGPRVQQSVFEFHLDSNRFNRMKEVCKKIINMRDDSIRFYKICEECHQKVEILGWGEVTEDREVYIL